MARFKNGINGGFSGKVGSVVGSSWRDVDYMRGKSEHSQKYPSSKQVLVREKFKKLGEFLVFFNEAIGLGLKNQGLKRMTAYNLAFRLNKDAFAEDQDELKIDYSRIVLSKGGSVGKPANSVAQWAGQSRLHIQWEIFGHSAMERPSDKVILAAYNEKHAASVSDTGKLLRLDKEAFLDFPENWRGSDIYVYMFMVSASGRCSETVFVGSFKQDTNG